MVVIKTRTHFWRVVGTRIFKLFSTSKHVHVRSEEPRRHGGGEAPHQGHLSFSKLLCLRVGSGGDAVRGSSEGGALLRMHSAHCGGSDPGFFHWRPEKAERCKVRRQAPQRRWGSTDAGDSADMMASSPAQATSSSGGLCPSPSAISKLLWSVARTSPSQSISSGGAGDTRAGNLCLVAVAAAENSVIVISRTRGPDVPAADWLVETRT